MQTLKTAAIVVLLFVVMYIAWVSMTKPPQEMSPELIDLVASDQEFSIDDGFGDSPGFEINTGVSEASGSEIRGSENSGSGSSLGGAVSGGVTNGQDGTDSPWTTGPNDPPSFAASGSDSGGVQWSGSDLPGDPRASNSGWPGSGQAGVGSMVMPSDAMNGERIASTDTRGIAAVTSGAAKSYPETGGAFEMPSPNGSTSALGGTSDFAPTDPASVSLSQGTDPASPKSAGAGTGFENALRTADAQYAADQRKEALATLSLFYNSPDLTATERQSLHQRLDPLAREVVYGPRHLLEQPRRVRAKETLMDIAAEFEVPWQLLQNINQISDPILMTPGTDLKVIRGPFRSEIDLSRNELTLFLGDLYAGRFPIAVGQDPVPKEGSYTVRDKLLAKTFYDQAGLPIPPGSPSNPYGSMWIDLGENLSLHGSPSPTRPTNTGCISVSGDHAKDIVAILSQGSSVTIRR